MEEVEGWFKTQGIYLHPSLCIESDTDGAGVYLKSGHEVPQDGLLCSIPLAAMLSHRTSSLQVDLSSIASHAMRLAAFVCHEMLLVEQSTWHTYLKSLPQNVPLLYTWSEDAKRLARGTELRQYLDFDDELRTMYESFVEPALGQRVYSYDRRATFGDYSWAYQMVQSRAFWVDSDHGLSLVPLADIFNHSPQPHTQLETDDHLDTVPAGSRTAEMRAARHLLAEDDSKIQIYNTYGDINNAQLVLRYGFTLEENPNDRITWSSSRVIAGILGRDWSESHKNSHQALLNHVEIEVDDEMVCQTSKIDHPQFYIDADARISLPLLLLLTVLVDYGQSRLGEKTTTSTDEILANPIIREGTAQLLDRLCSSRFAAITHNQSLDTLFDLKDTAEKEGQDPARVMALSTVVEEAVKVQACKAIWQDYIDK